MTKNLKNYGIVKKNLLKRTDLSVREKMIYVVIAVKQGPTDHAKISNRQIADALGISIQYVARAIKKLRTKLKLLKKEKEPNQISRTNYASKNKQYGVVEMDMLITKNLSLYAKYLYTIYCVVGNKYDSNNWSRDSICKQFKLGKSKYYDAHSELVKKVVLKTQSSAKGNGIQSSNINSICRAENFNIQKPASWLKKNYSVVNLKYIGTNVKFPVRVYKPKTLLGDDWLYENVHSGQAERTDEDNPDEQQETTQENVTGQRTVSNITISNIKDNQVNIGLTNQMVLDPDWLQTEEGTSYVGMYIEKSFGYLSYVETNTDEARRLFNIIYKLAEKYAMKNLNWEMSEEDEDYLIEIMDYWEEFDELPYLIGEGFVKCYKENDWRFGQIIYRAHTAVMNRIAQGY